MPKRQSGKPRKPYPSFPLTPHVRGGWVKKIGGRLFYFADPDPDKALREYRENLAGFQAGIDPRREGPKPKVTLADLVNLFLHHAHQKRDAGELSPLSLRDYVWTGGRMVEHFGRDVDPQGLKPADFAEFRLAIVGKYAPSRAGKTITVCKMMFRWGHEYEHLETLPRWGKDFKGPSKKAKRVAKANAKGRVLEAADIRTLLDAADAQFQAVILCGVNAALGNLDVSELRERHLDLQGGWLNLPRSKTGIERRAALWDETVQALQDAIASRRKAVDPADADRVFLTARGTPLMVVSEDGRRTDNVGVRFTKLLSATGLRVKGRGFYALRHSFRTIADETLDDAAIRQVMGHADDDTDMGNVYRHHVDDSRLRAVCSHVRTWLLGAEEQEHGLRIVRGA